MAAAATDKKKRLPKELQDYKREIKKLPFEEKVKAYFNCSPFTSDLDSQKKVIIMDCFTKEERKEYYRKYLPIYNAIDRYTDRIRAINGNRIIYANFINASLNRKTDALYTADLLNLALNDVDKALGSTNEDSTREILYKALKTLKSYRRVTITAPEIVIQKDSGRYGVPTEKTDDFLKGAIYTLKGILSLLKCYLEALKEFLEWVGTPELLPKEFEDMEKDLLFRFNADSYTNNIDEVRNPQAEDYPLFHAKDKVGEEFVTIDYKSLPRSIDIFGDKNLFANAYRRFFIY